MSTSRVPGQRTPEHRPPFVAASERRQSPEPPPLAPDRRLGVALIGLGRLSLEAILPAIGVSKLVRLAAVMTGDKAKGARVAEEYGAPADAVFGYDEWDALGQREDVAFVYIVTPNGMHCAQVLAAARVGKPVLCEKPMANSSAEARRMIDACEKAGVPLMIAYRAQYEPHNREVVRLARSGALGALKMIEAHNGQVQDTADQWRHVRRLAGGGALPDVGLYCLNFARFVTGEEPVRVLGWAWSTPGDPRFAEVEENVAWQMAFPSGVVARLSTAYDAHESRSARLHFQKATVILDPAFAYRGLRLRIRHRSTEREDVEVDEEIIIAEQDQFATELDHMAECLLTGRAPLTPGEEGLQDHLIMEAIYESSREDRPVALPGSGRLDAFRGPSLDAGQVK